ncbi:hypothetical protein ACHAXT_004715 [Thalassiosira profunda]
MSRTLPPLHRHLSTIGISSVFVLPPPHSLPSPPVEDGGTEESCDVDGSASVSPPSTLLPTDDQNGGGRVVDTWEIVGDIKSRPEDFVVREIGWAPPTEGEGHGDEKGASTGEGGRHSTGTYKRRPGWARRIAGVDYGSESGTQCPRTEDGDGDDCKCGEDSGLSTGEKGGGSVEEGEKSPTTLKLSDEATSSMTLQSEEQTTVATTFQKSESEKQQGSAELDPTAILRRILGRCHSEKDQPAAGDTGFNKTDQKGPDAKADATMNDLAHLQRLALEKLESVSQPATEPVKGGDDDINTVRIPTRQLSSKEDRKQLHQCIRQAFPLLQTETGTSNAKGASGDGRANGTNGQSVKVSIDTTFFPLAQYLYSPRKDILLLYAFRNKGPVHAPSNGRRNNRARPKQSKKWRKNRGDDRNEQAVQKGDQPDTEKESTRNSDSVLVLRLRPDVPRSERRAIHQTLSGRRRDFDTSTRNDVPLNSDDGGAKQTSAIVVQWSFNAIRASGKKRKLDDRRAGITPNKRQPEGRSSISAIFCVLKKHQCEHQLAIKSLTEALRCRPGDIGLAGMKDLQAVTYQFCTLRNVDMQRAQRANHSLGKKVQLSDLVNVNDFLLDRGSLLGNRFEITIRNLKRVQRIQMEGEDYWTESFVPVHKSHVDAMVSRVRDTGFINFYGEQRLGDAGSRRHVGVRSFDVGRAMLKRDFDTAIDLIMTGRSSAVYSPGSDEINARQVWRKSGGDARATLKAFPQNRSVMVRERDLLKGLLRYGNALEAFRCIPHNVRLFWIHAYQSYVWNRAASERVRRWGLRPVKGDLYLEGDENCTGDETEAMIVQVVTDPPESVDISQIVLPLPGYNVDYPSNEMGRLYQQLLKDDGIDLSTKGNIPEATAKGIYRKLIQRANDLEWEAIPKDTGGQLDESEDPVVASARFTFELASGCYATVLLRELMLTTMARDSKVNI